MNFIDEANAETTATTAATAAPGATPGASEGDLYGAVLPFVAIFIVFYFLILRPQQRKFKEHQAMVSAIRRGDKVVTSGGILGKVVKIDTDEGTVQVEIADNVTVKVLPATISSVITDKPLNDNSKNTKEKKKK